MQALAAAAIGLLVAVSIAVGFRLLALHRRSGGAPELLLGLMLLLSVGVGYPLLIAADRAGADVVRPLLVVSSLAREPGLRAAVRVHVARVPAAGALGARPRGRRRRSPWSSARLALLRRAHRRPRSEIGSEAVAESLIQTTTVMAAYLWTAWEALRYHGLMRRRVRIGLADPAVSDRFLLWGLMSLFVTAGVLLNTVAIALRIEILEHPVGPARVERHRPRAGGAARARVRAAVFLSRLGPRARGRPGGLSSGRVRRLRSRVHLPRAGELARPPRGARDDPARAQAGRPRAEDRDGAAARRGGDAAAARGALRARHRRSRGAVRALARALAGLVERARRPTRPRPCSQRLGGGS